VIERFAPGVGGVENVAWQVAHELTRVGEDVTVIARETASESRVPSWRVFVPTFWQPLRVLGFDRAAARLAYGRPALPFDVVHSFSRTRHQHLYRTGGGSHADYLRRGYGSFGRVARQLSPRHRVLLGIERRVFADPQQRIQCSSRLVADALISTQGVARDRILLLPNGVDAARFGAPRNREAGERLRAREDWPPVGAPLWLFPGSGWRRKGLDRVLAALAHEKARQHRLWIVGRDNPKPWKRRAAELGVADRVRFLGQRSDLEVLYHAVDAMLLPTRYDAFANVTLEAAAAGLPIVTSSANGAAEWLGDDICVVQRPDERDALATALSEFESPERRRAAGKNLARRILEFGWDRHVETLREEYRRIAARREHGASG
jgi:UDP-glucose:(heptosyl)LPS alpha-1,3-glucosyltransferase